jgi:putative ABC transport system permease protein
VRLLANARVAFFLAARSLSRGNAGVTLLTIVMMAVIFISVLFLPSLITGAIAAITLQITSTTASDLQISPGPGSQTITDSTAYLSEVCRAPGVAAATATLRIGTEIENGSESNAWGVDAIDPESYAMVFATPGHLIEGRYLTPDDTSGILLGVDIAGADDTSLRAYANSLKTVHTGDQVEVTLTSGVRAPFTVRGIYRNFFPLSDAGAFVTDAAARSLLPRSQDIANRVYVKAAAGTTSDDLVTSVGGIRPDLKYQTPQQLTAAIQDQIDTFDLINNIMRVISLLVAAITVFIVTYVELTARRRQIGIERAIGIRSGAIVGSYLIKAVVTAGLGILLGLAAFMLAIVPYVAANPFRFPNGPVALVVDPGITAENVVILLFVALFSALIPAWRTVTMKILDAIWGT